MTSNAEFHLQQLHPLVGGTITALARTGPGEGAFDEEFFGLVVTLPNGQRRTLILLSDAEGNGPGSFEIVD